MVHFLGSKCCKFYEKKKGNLVKMTAASFCHWFSCSMMEIWLTMYKLVKHTGNRGIAHIERPMVPFLRPACVWRTIFDLGPEFLHRVYPDVNGSWLSFLHLPMFVWDLHPDSGIPFNIGCRGEIRAKATAQQPKHNNPKIQWLDGYLYKCPLLTNPENTVELFLLQLMLLVCGKYLLFLL